MGEIMTYQVTVTLRSGEKIKGITDEHPVIEEGIKGHLVTLHMVTDDDMDTLINMSDVTMVQCKREVDESDPLLMKLTKSRIGYYNPIKRAWEGDE